jgi:uncharacterized protein YraI
MKRSSGALLVLFAAILLLALVPSLSTEAQQFGSNWTAIVYNTPNLTGTNQTIMGINGINFNWQAGPPTTLPGFNLPNCTATPPVQPPYPDNGTSANCANYFSIRFTSSQVITPGNYNFVVSSDDGVRVIINGQTVLDRFVGRPVTTDQFPYAVTTSPVNIEVQYFEGYDNAQIQFQWFLQGTVLTPGFGTPLFTPTPLATAVPPLNTSVSNSVRGLAVRSGPYLGASLITVAVPGQAYNPTARSQDEGGPYTWYLITVNNKTGWVSGRYLELTGDPNSVPVQSTIFEQIDNAPDVGVIASPRSVMNFRRRPSRRAALLGQIPWGAEMPLIGRTIQGGQNFWFQVRYNGQVGWIYAPFVSVRGDINAVPVR